MPRKVSEVKDLGFIINRKLDFSKHVSTIRNSARKRAFSIFRVLKTQKMNVLSLAYVIYVRSILESGSIV